MAANEGTVWAPPAIPREALAGPSMSQALLADQGQVDIRKINRDKLAQANPNRDGLLTDYAKPGAAPEDPRTSAVFQDVENRDYLCKVCNTVLHSMTEFNQHCAVGPWGNGREMRCEVEGRNAKNGPDPTSIAQATALALAPSLNAIGEALAGIAAVLAGKPVPKKPGRPRKNVGKKDAGSPASLPRKARPGGPSPLCGVGQPEVPLVDPPQESNAPPTA